MQRLRQDLGRYHSNHGCGRHDHNHIGGGRYDDQRSGTDDSTDDHDCSTEGRTGGR
jgi:hypothetical protein